MFNKIEPVKLIGEGEYNLDALTEIEVTKSFLGLGKEVRHCGNEPLFNCTTRHYLNNILEQCRCLPLNIKLTNEVSVQKCIDFSLNILCYLQEPLCSSEDLKCVKSVKVENYNCQKSCSGLFVTSFSKSEQKRTLVDQVDLLPLFASYKKYKKITTSPPGYKGIEV